MAVDTVGNILLKSTSMSEKELSALFDSETADGLKLGEVLRKKNISTPDEALAELCKILDLDFLKDIPVNDIPADLIRNIPINYAKTHSILPFKDNQGIVTVLTSNPLNYKVMDDL